MKKILITLLGIGWLAALQLHGQGTTAFTYQGQLRDGGTNANGSYTMIFKLYDSVSAGSQIGSTITTIPTLFNGLFTVNLDFGNVFDGNARWLDITVSNGVAQTLSPRVQVLPTPYAQFAAVAATVTNGAIMNAQLAANAVADTNIVCVSGSKVSGTVASAATLINGTWNTSVGTYQSIPNVFGIYDNNSLVLGMSANGVSVNADKLEVANELAIGETSDSSGGSISGEPNGGLTVYDGNGAFSVDNINVSGNIQVAGEMNCGDWDIGVDNNFLTFSANGGTWMKVDSTGHFVIAEGRLNVVNDGVNSGNISADGDVNAGGSMNAQSFNTTSDRNLKEKFEPVNSREILERVASLSLSSWDFKTDKNTRHIGPMAQDFYAAFNVGPDDKHIATVDEGGVALAAIQGLNQKLDEKDAEIADLKARLEKLEKFVNTKHGAEQ